MNDKLNKIYNTDCIKGMQQLPDNSIDLIVTSPPYNKKGLSGGRVKIGNNIWKKFNIDYNLYEDNMSEDEYNKWQKLFLEECYRILKPNGSLFYNHKIRRHKNQAFFPTWVFDSPLKLYQMIVWDRRNCCDMRKDYLYPTTELIFWLTKGKPKVFKDNAEHQKEIWSIAPSKGDLHPASFPEELARNCIKLTTFEGDIVLDPFMGSGTTAIAAIETSRNYIGFEISKEYCEIAEKRINEMTCQLTLKGVER